MRYAGFGAFSIFLLLEVLLVRIMLLREVSGVVGGIITVQFRVLPKDW